MTGVALLVVAFLEGARGKLLSAAAWFVAGGVLVVWGCWRLKSPRR